MLRLYNNRNIMSFIEPFLLWGALAVVIPIAIHFWHQKQGKPLPWAASQWLVEKQQQQSRGLRLDNIWLMLLRCLLLSLLALLLAQPVLNGLTQTPAIQKVHLVQPSASLAANFRFELSEAQKKGEQVLWATPTPSAVNEALALPDEAASFNPLTLQTAIQKLDTRHVELHLYILNNQALTSVPAITVPTRFRLHALRDTTRVPGAYLSVQGNKKLYVNRAGKLVSSPSLDPTLTYAQTPANTGPLYTLLSYHIPRERQTVKAALAALTDVYGLDLTIDEQPVPNRIYRWVLTDQLPSTPNPQTLYVVSGLATDAPAAQQVFTNETLTPGTSDRVETGQLPEWLGTQLLAHSGLMALHHPLSQQDLRTLFVPTTQPTAQQQAGLQNGLLLAFIVLVLVERWFALTKNA